MSPQEYFTVKETSIILGFSTNSIYKFLKVGRLYGVRGSKKQGRFRIPQKAIEEFLDTPLSPEYIAARLNPHHTSPAKPTPPTETAPPSTVAAQTQENPVPLKLTRILIIGALIALITDILFSNDFSLFQQLIRLSILAIAILIAYQFGDHHDASNTNQL